ncbi:hypothetical protein [Ferruginibacter sp. HRS2-29]|uniref:hypothetical protein n=1 Tax=Ferruginibacter sp. HRS2-29 TaxID=2487334 RepID=UPI0020CC25AE|nr:hypothetical protein [Ferruginibacter sp. HRS2-29]MCP9753328.1 hypothetical protein [Ferruginibacter sp. HRS2-29]
MNKRSSLILALLLVILLASVVFNIYLFKKNEDLETKVKTFIPAALSLESENKRLLENEKACQEKLDQLTFFQDSILNVLKKNNPALTPENQLMTPYPSTTPADPSIQQQQAPMPQTGTFKDLNKGIQ